MYPRFLLIVIIVTLFSCSSLRKSDREVTSLFLSPSEVFVEDESDLEIRFVTEREIDGSPEPIQLVVHLPMDVQPDLEKSFLSQQRRGDSIERIPNIVEDCSDGSQILFFVFDAEELSDTDFDEGEYLLTFPISAAKIGVYNINARASKQESINCGAIVAQQTELLFVI